MEESFGMCAAGGYAALMKGRHPLAVAELTGIGEHGRLYGHMWVYATPTGTLISIRVSGLPSPTDRRRKGAVYGLCLHGCCGCGEGGKNNELCGVLPLLYEREGNAWCSVLTKKLTADILIIHQTVI